MLFQMDTKCSKTHPSVKLQQPHRLTALLYHKLEYPQTDQELVGHTANVLLLHALLVEHDHDMLDYVGQLNSDRHALENFLIGRQSGHHGW